MSIFSSLNYLLTKAASAINQTTSKGQSQDRFFQGNNFSNQLSQIFGNEISTLNSTSYKRLQFLLNAGKLFGAAKTSNSIGSSITGNLTSIITLSTSISEAYLGTQYANTSESYIQFLNDETYPNADHLLDSWWNIFDARYLRHGWGLTVALIVAYMIMLVAGVIGNIMVILVVLLRPQMRSVTNMFIMNLAVADLFVIVLCVPATLLANVFAPWILGTFMCKAVAYVQGVAVCASAYSLAAISLDRCQAVYRNYEQPRGFSQRVCFRTVLIIWVAAISLTVPWAVTFDVKVSDYDGLRYCVETWGNEKQGNAYFLVVNFFGFYAVPLLLIFVSNWIIYCHVMHRHEPDKSAASAPLRKLHRDTKRHVLKMLGIVTLTFLISWLPVYILVIIIKFSDNLSESEYNMLKILMPIAQWFGSWNSSINPILYAFLNKKFRTMFKSILPAWIPVKGVEKYLGSRKTPNYTTEYTERIRRKSEAICKFDCRIYPNGQGNSQYQANLLISKYKENTGMVATSSIQTISSVISESPISSIGSPGRFFNTDVSTRFPFTLKNHRHISV